MGTMGVCEQLRSLQAERARQSGPTENLWAEGPKRERVLAAPQLVEQCEQWAMANRAG